MAGAKRFKREGKRYKLNFEDGELDGFECVMRGISLEQFIEMTMLEAELRTPEGKTPENVERQYVFLAGLLVAWNLDDEDDKPVPPDYAGLKAQDFEFVMQIQRGYMQAVATVPKASDGSLNSGGSSLEQSIPMDPP